MAHHPLSPRISKRRFREDLYARINLWTFDLPGLAQRNEDIAPNLDFELERFARDNGTLVCFNVEAKRRYLAFATSPDARWSGNFRELSASVTRMATLAESGRIDESNVAEEIARLRRTWGAPASANVLTTLLGEQAATLDLFDRVQLECVIRVCRESRSLSDAGRKLFAVSRDARTKANDADRLRKYLARFDLRFDELTRQ